MQSSGVAWQPNEAKGWGPRPEGLRTHEIVIDSTLVAVYRLVVDDLHVVKVNIPFILGLPERIPTDLFRWRFSGRWPDNTDHSVGAGDSACGRKGG